jgi:predicted GNAT superfamily acetyltransferase
MRDGINQGVASDRFVVEWWINSPRVNSRLSKRPRLKLDLAHFLAGEVEILNPSHAASTETKQDAPAPEVIVFPCEWQSLPPIYLSEQPPAIILVEIPANFQALRSAAPGLAADWRSHTRLIFEALFDCGYLVTDFVHLPAPHPADYQAEWQGESTARGAARSFYVLSFGESTL